MLIARLLSSSEFVYIRSKMTTFGCWRRSWHYWMEELVRLRHEHTTNRARNVRLGLACHRCLPDSRECDPERNTAWHSCSIHRQATIENRQSDLSSSLDRHATRLDRAPDLRFPVAIASEIFKLSHYPRLTVLDTIPKIYTWAHLLEQRVKC